ncbi:MAG TPA: MFS transporter [Chlamydiales bacterium]|nr:MFS transporter [Chlamydiales bacterium]
MKKPAFFSDESPFYPFLILTNVIITTLFTVVSAVVTIIANTSIQGELALSDTASIWVTTLYLLGINTTVPVATWLANHFGDTRMYTYGVLLFTLGSAIVGFSNHFAILAVARVIEGVGAGLIFPIGLGLIVRSLPKEKISLALNLYIGGAFGGGLGLGIPLSGYLTQYVTWRAVFWLIIPLGLLAALFCWLSRRKVALTEKTPFDPWGFLLFATFIASLLIALTLAPIKATTGGWRSWYIIALLLLSAICLIATIIVERRHSHPNLPIVLFKDSIFTISSIAMFLLGMSLFASVAVSIDYMINALGYEKFVTGKIAMVYGLTMASCSILASQLIKIIPVPVMTFAGLSILIYSYFLNNELNWLTGVDQVLWILFLRGMGTGLALGPTTLLALHGIAPELRGSAATLLTFFRQIGNTYGGTLVAIFTIRRTIFHAARFGEQANNQLPAYKMAFYNLYDKFPDASQAKAAIVKNIEIQAYIQGLNDAMIIFGYITCVVTAVLLITILIRMLKMRTKSATMP